MQIGEVTPASYARGQADMMVKELATVRFSQRIVAEIISGTFKLNEEQRQVAQSTDYEKNFSRVNLLV